MPDHEPFDGTVPWVLKLTWAYRGMHWVAGRPGKLHTESFPTWREAMNYATKEDHR